MQVNVFITRKQGQLQRELLVLPVSPQTSVPPKYRSGWNYYATVDTRDRMFGEGGGDTIEAALARTGFAVMTPQAPDRR